MPKATSKPVCVFHTSANECLEDFSKTIKWEWVPRRL